MKSTEFITELFSAPLQYQWGAQDGPNWWGKFLVPGATPDEKPMKVVIDFTRYGHTNPPRTDVAFAVNSKFELTGGGHALEIFATVGKMFDEYLSTVKPEFLRFNANAKEPSRIRLYNRLASGLAQKYGYKLEKKTTKAEIYYHLLKQ